MNNRIPPFFKVTTLAAALMTLSGCATSSLPAGTAGIGQSIGETIMDAGRVTANASLKAFETTTQIVGLDRLNRSNDENADEVDVAQQDTLNTWPAEQSAVATGVNVPPTAEAQPIGMPAIASIPAIDPNAIPVATVDYTHKVGQQETMWTIAKSTTGNANNWRILAEINQLDLNTPMQIGQEILVPADLVLPELVASLTPSELLQNTTTDVSSADASGRVGVSVLPPLDLPDSPEVAIEPISQASLESDPINPAPAADIFTGDDGEELIIVEASASTPAVTEDVIEEAAIEIDPTLGAVALKADLGETLWDMAKRTTGDATNWKPIAEHNGFSESDIGRIRYGQTIYVPAELAKAEFGGDKVEENSVATIELAEPDAVAEIPAADAAADAAATDNLVAASTENTDQQAIDATAELVASTNNLLDETQDIQIVEATYTSTDVESVVPVEVSQTDQIIMVSGTYYPKAVYNEADFSSSLLMRVSPGTEMTVSKAMGAWFEVQTENGIGYMHSRDIK